MTVECTSQRPNSWSPHGSIQEIAVSTLPLWIFLLLILCSQQLIKFFRFIDSDGALYLRVPCPTFVVPANSSVEPQCTESITSESESWDCNFIPHSALRNSQHILNRIDNGFMCLQFDSNALLTLRSYGNKFVPHVSRQLWKIRLHQILLRCRQTILAICKEIWNG